jgi:hypothetical protein
MTTIVENGIKIESEIDCWCGFKAHFHHTSGIQRKDGKLTVWYKCRSSHATSIDVNYKSTIPKESIKKKKEKKKDGKEKETKVST